MRKNMLQVLQEARARLAKRNGWIKGESHNGRAGYCATGAIYYVMGGHIDRHKLYKTLAKQIPDKDRIDLLNPHSSILLYNDRPETKKEDILDMFDKAIKYVSKKRGVRAVAKKKIK